MQKTMKGMRAAPALLAAAAIAWALAVPAFGETWVQDTWQRTTYYRATFAASEGQAGQLYVAAVDSYAVYLNGAPVAGDSTWARMGVSPIVVNAGDNHLAVVVANRGGGVGHGLVVRLETDSTRAVTTTDRSLLTWRWTDEAPDGSAWRTAPPGEDWQPVQGGLIDTAAIAGFGGAGAEVVAGYGGGVDAGGEVRGVTLKRIQGENLALDKPANRVETVDGDLLTAWEPPVASLNFTASVDLRDRFLVHRVRVLTKGPGYESNSLRGYSVQVSDDQVRWSEVAALHDITDYVRTEVSFTPTWTRFVRIVIIQINAVTRPMVAELEVYGDGYAEDGAYVSGLLDLGVPQSKNLGHLDWEAEVPDRTELTVQFRTGSAAADFGNPDSGWSAPLETGSIWYPAAEPGSLMQYRVNMETRDELRAPVFQRLSLDYSIDDLPASAASAWVTPNQLPMGVDTTFTFGLDLSVGSGDLGVERLQIAIPAEATVDVGGIEGIDVPLAAWYSSQDTLTLIFDEPVRSSGRVLIPLRTRTWSNLHEFRAFLYSPGSDNPLNAVQDSGDSWELLATSTRARVLSQVRASPPVLTPNGDGVNDDTVIEFVLAKVDVPRRVSIRIADLSGRAVVELGVGHLASGSHQRPSRAAPGTVSAGRWDGRDTTGALVPPGLYLYRVEVELDRGSEVEVGAVGVAY